MADRKKLIIWAIIGTGISSIAVQLITIREYLSQFHGNEITISLVLFCWLLITGLGSLAARPFKRSSFVLYALLLVLIGVWPLIQLILIRNFREILFTHGISPGFYQILFYTMVTLAPYCLMLGFILPHSLTVLHNSHYEFTSGELYLTDSIGDTSGGILFSFALVYWVKPFKSVAFTSTLMIIVGLILLISARRTFLLFLTSVCVILFCFLAFDSSFEVSTLSKQYGDIMRYVESPYGRIVVSREGPQHTFWESGTPLYSSADIIGSEEKIHYPLVQLERVESVLLVSGGLGESLGEVEKYHPDRTDYVELDPYLTEAAQEFGFIKNLPSLGIKNTDGRSYIKTTDKRYDAIIVDLPDPDTFQINRFYTSEFFSLSKRILSKGGVLSFGLEYSPNYISDVEKKKLSIMFNTAKSHFQNVMILPGAEAYFLCSDGELSTDIPSRLRAKSIITEYIDGFYYGNVTKERIDQIQDVLDREEYQNTDFEPRIMNVMFQEWFLKHGTSPKIFILILAGLVFFYIVFMRKEEYILFSTGLANMGVEMLVIFSFQVIYGYIYLKIGAIITVSLLGLLPGAAMGSLYEEGNKRVIVFSEVALLGLILIFFVWNNFLRGELHQLYFLGYCFTFSFFCGLQFPLAAKMIGERQSPAAGCLAADLAGAAVGTLVVGTLLIPLWGIQSAIIFLIFVKISSNMIILFSKP